MDPIEKTSQNEYLEVDTFEVSVLPPSGNQICKLAPADYIRLAAEWFNLDLANGDARADTISTYADKVGYWFQWCGEAGVDPGNPHTEEIKLYRKYLVEK